MSTTEDVRQKPNNPEQKDIEPCNEDSPQRYELEALVYNLKHIWNLFENSAGIEVIQ